MVELVDTQDLESCEETRAGSIPVIRTSIERVEPLWVQPVLLVFSIYEAIRWFLR